MDIHQEENVDCNILVRAYLQCCMQCQTTASQCREHSNHELDTGPIGPPGLRGQRGHAAGPDQGGHQGQRDVGGDRGGDSVRVLEV